jgi:hypothetical protein
VPDRILWVQHIEKPSTGKGRTGATHEGSLSSAVYLDKFDKRTEEGDLRRYARWLLERLLWVFGFPVFIVTVNGKFAIETAVGKPLGH